MGKNANRRRLQQGRAPKVASLSKRLKKVQVQKHQEHRGRRAAANAAANALIRRAAGPKGVLDLPKGVLDRPKGVFRYMREEARR